jgi:IS30 family transposase
MQRSISTLSDELKRNQVKGIYDAKKAQHKAYARRKYSKYQGMKIVSENRLRDFVEENLLDGQSPENISGRIKKVEKELPTVSKDSIYRFIESPYGRQIEFARTNGRRKGNKRGKKKQPIADRNFINERPESINERSEIGDAEADFIVSGKDGKGILLVIVDRKTRAAFVEKITDVSIENVHLSFVKIQQRFPEMKTITTDNDILFRKHKELEKLLSIKIYFCHPYHSWEKGTVENTNKYIRKDIPKESNISKYSKKFILSVEEKLNRRFMKCLAHATPNELLKEFRNQKNRQVAKCKSVRIEPVG